MSFGMHLRSDKDGAQRIYLKSAHVEPRTRSHIALTASWAALRHNQTRNTIARLLQKAGCKGVEVEQQLLPVEGELDGVKEVEKGDESKMDVTAFGFWGAWQRAFFDIRVFDPIAPSYAQKSLNTLFQSQEKEKKRKSLRSRKRLSHLLFSRQQADVAKNVILSSRNLPH